MTVMNKTNTSFLLAVMASFLASSPTLANTCGAACEDDRDCHDGGFVECGKCNLYQGTLGYKTCYNDQPDFTNAPTPAPTHNYFPGAGTCANSCVTDSDCWTGGFNPCGSCGQEEGTEMYQLCFQPESPEPFGPGPVELTASPTPAPTHNFFPEGGSCALSCNFNSDCQNGGFNPCGTCGNIVGTEMYQLCYQPEEEEEGSEDFGPGRELNTCNSHCESDSDCHHGGFVECGKCNLYQGTLGYKTCYNDQPSEPTNAPTPAPHNYFPVGGSCRNSCVLDSDCQPGGFNACGKCGQVPGTQMYGLCFQPENEGGRNLRRRM